MLTISTFLKYIKKNFYKNMFKQNIVTNLHSDTIYDSQLVDLTQTSKTDEWINKM